MPWRVSRYYENGMHVIDICEPRDHDEKQFVLDILVTELNAKIGKVVIGPYFVMTYVQIEYLTVAFITDDAEGYPISITSRDEFALPIMLAIESVLKTELCPPT